MPRGPVSTALPARMGRWTGALCLLLLLAATALHGAVFYVDPAAGGDNSGGTWDDACTSLTTALSAAASGDEIWVKAGTYKPGALATDSFTLKSGVGVYGGFAGVETARTQRSWRVYPTILSGNLGGGIWSNNIVKGTSLTGVVLDGFVIRDGAGGTNGGGIAFTSVTGTIANCVVTANTASHGGGLYSTSGNLTVNACVFMANTTPGIGGGVRLQSGTGGVFTNCIFQGNTAAFSVSYAGGGVFLENLSANTTKFINCTFQGNAATGATPGGACVSYGAGNPAFTNCIFWGNTAGVAGTANIHHASSGTSTASYSTFEGGLPTGTTNGGSILSTNPLFTSTADLDGSDNLWGTTDDGLIPTVGSPVVNSGTTTDIPVADLRGGPRNSGGSPDRGAYERNSARVYVKKGSSGTGTSWANAWGELSDALYAADAAEVWVAAGTYSPTQGTNAAQSFKPNTGTQLYGGFVGTESALDERDWTLHPTVLSGEIGVAGATDNSQHVVVGANSGILDGFVIRDGNASLISGYGGGLMCLNTSPTVSNCVFTANTAYYGGAIQANGASANPTFENCLFAGNSATGGGALLVDGSARATFRNCTVAGNSAASGSGLVVWSAATGPTVVNSIFWGNTGSASVYLYSSGATFSYSDVEGSGGSASWSSSFGTNGGSNKDVTPSFANLADPDGVDNVWGTLDDGLIPGAASQTVDTGTATGAPARDLRKTSRGLGGYDMGAYERRAGGVVYVRAAAVGANNGTSWTNAYTELRDALASGLVSGDQVWVATGTYTPTTTATRTIAFRIPAGVAVYGGFAGVSETLLSQRQPASNICTLSGNINDVGLNTDNSYQVVTIGGGGCVVDGFTISDGYGPSSGAGIYGSFSGNLTVANCVVRNNYSTGNWGGGVALIGCQLTMADCRFLDNTSTGYGGGMLCQDMTGTPLIERCVFRGNYAAGSYGGGGMFIYSSVATVVRNCLFAGNIASGNASFGGGAAFCHSSNGSLFDNCTMQGNSVSISGGYGGAMHISGTAILRNSIFWSNTAAVGSQVYGGGTASYCDFLGGIPAGTTDAGGNISSDPLFANSADPDGADNIWGTWDDGLFPTATSPTRDAGTAVAGTSLELRQISRPSGAAMDMGCYERRVWYFNESAGGDESGGTWDDAFISNLQSAWNTAQAGDELWVAAGAYMPTATADRTISFAMRTGVAYYGGFLGTETALSQRDWTANQSFLDGDIGTGGVFTDNSYHVVVGASQSTLDGFVIRNGTANGTSPSNVGGGVYCPSVSPTLRNCVITANRSNYDGPGVYCISGAAPLFDRCAITGNLNYGTGVYGGGVCSYSSSPQFWNCLIAGNAADSLGGGMYLNSSNAWLWNCTIVGNTSGTGSGLYCSGSSAPTLTNCIVWSNTVFNASCIPSWEGCDVQGSGGTGAWVAAYGNDDGGNLDADPLFLAQADLDGADGRFMTPDDGLRLTTGSPCVDANPPGDAPDGDLAGGVRPHGGQDDLGCYEGPLPTAQFAVSSSSASEAVTTVNLTVTLSAATNLTVSVPFSVSGSSTATAGTDFSLVTASPLVFTPGQTSKTIQFTVANDLVAENSETAIVTLGVSTNARLSSPADYTYTITDNDPAGVTVSAISGHTTEAGGTATFTVVLNSQPTANVVIPLSSSRPAEGTVGTANLTFTSGNWNTAQTVTVTGVNDAVDDDNQSYSILTGACSTTDAFYQVISAAMISDVAVINDDNDTASVTVSAISGHTTEAGGTATFTVRLESQPTATVTIPVSSDDLTEGTVSPASLVFDAGNWSSLQTVTVTGVDDASGDGNITYNVVLAAASSTDVRYGGMNPADRAVINDDNDAAGFVILPAATVVVTEAGGTAAITVKLASQPSANVTITVVSGDGTEGTVSPASLTFTSVNWNSPQSITVTGVNDDIDDGDITWAVILGADSATSDTGYKNLNPADPAVSTTDDDTAGFTITPTSGLVTTEAGGTASFTVKLNSEPTAAVSLPLTSSVLAEGTVSPASVNFTTGNWNTPQTVTVTGVNDSIVDGPQAYAITTGNPASADPNYNGAGKNPVDVSVTNNDNDVGSVVLSKTTAAVSEAGATDSYQVHLALQPGADVTITITPDAQTTRAPATLTFTSANWSVDQPVTVGAVNDSAAEGVHGGSISHSASGGGYTGVAIASVTATITDNDSAGVAVGAMSGDVTEGGATASYNLVLNSLPTANVVVTITPDAQQTVSTGTLTFTTANWSTPQTVTVTAVNDVVDEADPHTGTISHAASSSDPAYGGVAVAQQSVNVHDNDVAAVDLGVLSSGGIIAEGGASATYTVVLHTKPTANVTVTPSPDAQVTVSPTSLLFTTGNWNVAQTVTVTAVNDLVDEDDGHAGVISHAATSATDTFYVIPVAGTRTASITDNDSAGYTITPAAGLTVSEAAGAGHATTFTVKLNSQPTANVVLDVSSNDLTEGTVSPATLTFTPANWSTTQTVTVTAADDFLDDEAVGWSVVLGLNATTDVKYQGIDPTDVTATTTDDDARGVVVLVSDDQTSEAGGTATFTVRLASQPTAAVTLALHSLNTGEGTLAVDPLTLSFTTANPLDADFWSTPQTVVVTGVDDGAVDPNHTYVIEFQACNGGDYTGENPSDLTLVNVDDEGYTISLSTSNVSQSEAGGATLVTITLSAAPASTVFVPVSSGDTDQATVSTGLVTILAGNTTGTFNILPVQDLVDDGTQALTVSVGPSSSADGNWHNLTTAGVAVSVSDDDVAGFEISQATLSVAESAGAGAFTVRLTSQPTVPVTIGVVSSDATEGTVSPASLTFTSATWNVQQTVTVTGVGVNEHLDDGDVLWSVLLQPDTGTADTSYLNLDPANVSVTTVDDDAATVVVTQSGGATMATEGGATDTYAVVLTAEPAFDVTITIAPDAQVTVSAATLTFTSANWDTPQTVTVTAFDDATTEGAHSGTINHTASGGGYGGVAVDSVTAAITDNDPAGVTATALSGGVVEGGATATYTLVLNTQPTGDVVVTVTPDAQLAVSPSVLTFTAQNYSSAQTVTVSAADDAVAEGVHIGTLAHSASGGGYGGVSISGLSASITDNDTPGVTVLETGGGTAVIEGGTTDTYAVVLTSQPTANVTVTLTADPRVGTGAASLLFTAGDWNIAQSVTVTATDDAVVQGQGDVSVTHAVTSADTRYNGISALPLTVAVTDNDVPVVTVVQSLGSSDVTEGGATDGYTVVLGAQPAGDVTITVSPDAQVTTSTASLLFTTGNWNLAQTVTITAVDDSVAEGAHSGTVSHSASGGGYSGAGVAAVTANISDNDNAGVVVTPGSGLTCTEAGGQASFTIQLTSRPTADVAIVVTGSDATEGMVAFLDGVACPDPVTVTITAAQWNVARTVTLVGVNDLIDDGDVDWGVDLAAAASADPSYSGRPVPDVLVRTIDNDSASVIIDTTVTAGVDETLQTSTSYALRLGTEPTGDVRISITPPAGQLDAAPTSVWFGPTALVAGTGVDAANRRLWSDPATITVSAVDDTVDETLAHSAIVVHGAAGGEYTGVGISDVTISIADNDTAGVSVTPIAGLTVTEAGGTATFSIVLDTKPTADVLIAIASSDVGEGVVSPSSLSFTGANWNSPQIVTISGVDDSIDDGAQAFTITSSATSADANYQDIAIAAVSTTCDDDDAAAIVVSAISGATSESGGTATFAISLAAQPLVPVTVRLQSGSSTEGRVSAVNGIAVGDPADLVFTAADWGSVRTVTVTGVDDVVADGPIAWQVTGSVTVGDGGAYTVATPVPPVAVSNLDNDSVGIVIAASAGFTEAAEGGATDSYTVVLSSQPSAAVTVLVTPDSQATVDQPSLSFLPGTWNTPQTVVVSAAADSVAEGAHDAQITHTTSSGDAAYNAITPVVHTVSVLDDDSAGVQVSPMSGPTSESGTAATFTIRLTSQPTANVTLTIASDTPGEGVVSAVDGTPVAEPATLTFTSGNWNVVQTVTVTGTDDAVADGVVAYQIISGSTASADPFYVGIDPSDPAVNNQDDDTVGLDYAHVGGSTDVTEGGTGDTYTVALHSRPLNDVTVTLTADAQVEVDTDLGMALLQNVLTFTAANWNVPQVVTITAFNDLIDEGGPHSGTVTPSTASADPAYNGLATPIFSATVTDNDVAAITVSAVTGSPTEAGGAATFTVVLATEPTSMVAIQVTSSDTTEGLPGTNLLQFTSADWNVPQTVTVNGVDDLIDDGDVAFQISLDSPGGDALYAALAVINVGLSNADNDGAGVIVTPGSVAVTEASGVGRSASVSLRLSSAPLADVTMVLGSDDLTEALVSEVDGTPVADPVTVTFTAANWNTAQVVTVSGVDDFLDDGDASVHIVIAAAVSGDGNYNGLDPADILVTTIDDDAVGVAVTPTSLGTTEGGAAQTFALVLTSQPTADVVVGLAGGDASEGTVAPAAVTFTSVNWNVPQVATVTPVHDFLDDGDVTWTVATSASSGDANYNGVAIADVTVVNTDIDVLGVTITQSGGNTAVVEGGGTDSYTVALNTLPSDNVVITMVADAQVQVDTSAAPGLQNALTFTPANWNVPQVVTVLPVDDATSEGPHSGLITQSAAGGGYTGVGIATVTVAVTDNDSAGVAVTPTAGLVTDEQGSTATFTVSLTSQPAANVSIAVASADAQQDSVSPLTVLFTPLTWNVAQTVTVTGLPDAIADGDVTHLILVQAATSLDANYAGIDGADVSVTNRDDDLADVAITPATGLAVSETGSSATFTVRLSSRPLADVSLAIASTDVAAGTVAPAALAFTAANWNVEQTVTVTGVDDAADDGDAVFAITTVVSSTDLAYDGLAVADVGVVCTDDDGVGLLVSQSAGSTRLAEGGSGDSFTVVLTSLPSGTVTVALANPDGQAVLGSPALTFTPATWNLAQTVDVAAVQDQIAEGAHAAQITFLCAGADYAGISAAAITATITDDDYAGVTVNPTVGLGTSESGGAAAFTVVLSSQPTANVSFSVTSADVTEGSVSSATLIFTAANWNVPQGVTVTGVDDDVVDGAVAYQIQLGAAASADPTYAGIDPTDVSASNADNDVAEVLVDPLTLVTAEDGSSATFTVVLRAQPAADVGIALSSSDPAEVTVAPGALTFTAANWSTPQTVTVTGVDDAGMDGPRSCLIITSSTASSDPVFAGLAVADVAVVNQDDDQPGILISTGAGLAVTEGGGTVSYQVRLASLPSAPVTVDITPDAQVTVDQASLVFTPANWNVLQPVVVTAVDDLVAEGHHQGVIAHLAHSADPAYDGGGAGLAGASVAANISDNDDAAVIVDTDAGTAGAQLGTMVTDEDGDTASFTIVLSSQPVVAVQIGVEASDPQQASISSPVLTFTSADWSTPQTVTITGLSDANHGSAGYSIDIDVLAGDANYLAIDPADLPALNQEANNPPAIDAIADLAIAEDPGLQTIGLSGIGSGQNGEVQELQVTAVSSVPGLTGALAMSYASPDAAGSIAFTPTAEASGSAIITVTVTDDGGTPGVPADDRVTVRTFTVTIAAVNDTPQVSVGAHLSVDRGLSDVLTTALLSSTDVEDGPTQLTYTLILAPSQGVLRNGVTSIGTLGSFTQQDIDAGLISYTHNGSAGAGDGFAFTVSDTGVPAPVRESPLQVFNIDITTTDPPLVSIPLPDLGWTEGLDGAAVAPVQIADTGSAFDSDSPDFNTGYLRVHLAGAVADDLLAVSDLAPISVVGNSVSYAGTVIGLIHATENGSGVNDLVVNFNSAAATYTAAQALLRAITYTNLGDDPPAGSRVLSVEIADGDGGLASSNLLSEVVRNLVVTAVDDHPVAADIFLATVVDLPIDGQVVASDPESTAVVFELTDAGGVATVNGGAILGSVSLDIATGAFAYTPAFGVSAQTDTFYVTARDKAGLASSLATTVTVQVHITGTDEAAPRFTTNAPMQVFAGTTLVPAVVIYQAQVTLSHPGLRWSLVGWTGGSPPSINATGAQGNLNWTIPTLGNDGGGSPIPYQYQSFGILVIDDVTHRAAFQPILVKVLAPAEGGG